MRDQELEYIDVARVAAALMRRTRIDEERHRIEAVAHDAEGERRHAAILVPFDARLIGQRQAHDIHGRDADARTDLHHAGGDKASLVLLLDERVAEYPAVPIGGREVVERHGADRSVIAAAAFEDTEGSARRMFHDGKRGLT